MLCNSLYGLVREVDGVGDPGHRFDADEVAMPERSAGVSAPGRARAAPRFLAARPCSGCGAQITTESKVGRTEHHVGRCDSRSPHGRATLSIALQIRKHIVEIEVVERDRSPIRKEDVG